MILCVGVEKWMDECTILHCLHVIRNIKNIEIYYSY